MSDIYVELVEFCDSCGIRQEDCRCGNYVEKLVQVEYCWYCDTEIDDCCCTTCETCGELEDICRCDVE